jgi:hypothetical protein
LFGDYGAGVVWRMSDYSLKYTYAELDGYLRPEFRKKVVGR